MNDKRKRTFVLRIESDEARVVNELPYSILRSWRSANGTAYCTAYGGQIVVFREDRWKPEQVIERQEDLDNISGISGQNPEDDLLFVTGRQSLLARGNQPLQEIGAPEDVHLLYAVCAVKPDEVYVGCDRGLLRWDGKAFELVDAPEGEIKAVAVLSDTEMLAVGNAQVHRWRDETGWEQLKSSTRDYGNWLGRLGDQVYLPSRKGLARYARGKLKKLNTFYCTNAEAVGDVVLAFGGMRGGLLVLDPKQNKSREIRLPVLAPGVSFKK
jgi:hypothetical protein